MTTGKTIALTRQTFVGQVMSLLFNMLSRLAIVFLPRSKCLFMAAVMMCSDSLQIAVKRREAKDKGEKERYTHLNEESEKVGLKLNIHKTKIMACGPITSWKIDGETVSDFILGDPKSLQMVTAAMKLKDAYSLEGKL